MNDDAIKDIEKPTSEGCAAGLLLQEDISKTLEETFTPVKAHTLNRPSIIMATPESQIKRRVDLQSQNQRRLDFQESELLSRGS